MTTTFRKSSDLIDAITLKVLAWGPENAGKSHLLHSAPNVAVIDYEHRSDSFRRQFNFLEVTPESVTAGIKAIDEIAARKVECSSVGIDGLTRPYESFIRRFTTTTQNADGKRTSITDWVSVNRESQNMMDAIFSIAGKNIICTAKQGSKLVAEGRGFKRDGVHMIGDEARWLYYFDYVLHYTARGCIMVTKSMSHHLPVGTDIRGDMDWARLLRLVNGEEAINGAPARRAQPTSAAPARASAPASAAPAAAAPATVASDTERAEGPTDVEMLLVNVAPAEVRRIYALARAKCGNDEQKAEARIRLLVGSIEGANAPLLPDNVEKLVGLLKGEHAA